MPSKPATYDPTSSTPYEAPPLPQVQQPAPSPLPAPSDKGFPIGPSKAGGIASIADQVMRGFMQGRAQSQANNAANLDHTTQALQAAVNISSKQLKDIVESNNVTQNQVNSIRASKIIGAIPDDKQTPEQKKQLQTANGVIAQMDPKMVFSLQQADQAVQGSWKAWITFLGQHVQGDQGNGKKGKKKGDDDSQKLPFLQRIAQAISGKDPAEVSRAVYDFYAKSGPPIYGTLAQVTSQAQLRADALKLESSKIGNQQSTEDALKTRSDILAVPEDKRTPEQVQQLKSAEEILASPTGTGQWETQEYAGPGGEKMTLTHDKKSDNWRDSDGNLVAGPPRGWTLVNTKSATHAKTGWSKDAQGRYFSFNLDENNQPVPGTENYTQLPPSNIAGSVQGGVYTFTNDRGIVTQVPFTKTTKPNAPQPAPMPGNQGASVSHLNRYSNPESEPREESYARNREWATPNWQSQMTRLSPEEEARFQQWATTNPHAVEGELGQNGQQPDYDIRGYWKALNNPNDPQHAIAKQDERTGHFPDYWKTPYSGVFSHESKFATTNAPVWHGDELKTKDGKTITAPQRTSGQHAGSSHSTSKSPFPDSRAIGYKGSKEYDNLVKQENDVQKSVTTAQNYLTEMKKSARDARAGDGPAQVHIIADFVKGVIGGASTGVRVTKQEWTQATDLAPFLTRWGAKFTDRGIYGIDAPTIAPSQVNDMIVEMGKKVGSLKTQLADIQTQKEKQKKSDIDSVSGVSSPPDNGDVRSTAPPPPEGKFPVTDPDNNVHYFNSQAEADEFRELIKQAHK